MTKQVELSVMGLLPRDHSGASIQTPSNFTTQDASTPAKTSPLSYAGTIIMLTVSDDAAVLVLYPSTDLKFSEDATMSRYSVIPGGAMVQIPVALMTQVYIQRLTSDGTLHFHLLEV